MFRRGRKGSESGGGKPAKTAAAAAAAAAPNGGRDEPGRRMWYKKPAAAPGINGDSISGRARTDVLRGHAPGNSCTDEAQKEQKESDDLDHPWDDESSAPAGASKGPMKRSVGGGGGPYKDVASVDLDRTSFITGTYNVSLRSLMEDVNEQPVAAAAKSQQHVHRYSTMGRNGTAATGAGGHVETTTAGRQTHDDRKNDKDDGQPPPIDAQVTPVFDQQQFNKTLQPPKRTVSLSPMQPANPSLLQSQLKETPLNHNHHGGHDLAPFGRVGTSYCPTNDQRIEAGNSTAVSSVPAHHAADGGSGSRNSVLQYRRAAVDSQQHLPEQQQLYGGTPSLQHRPENNVKAVGAMAVLVSSAGIRDNKVNGVDDYYSRYAQKIDSYYTNAADDTGNNLLRRGLSTEVLRGEALGLSPGSFSSDYDEEKQSFSQQGMDRSPASADDAAAPPVPSLADSMQANIQVLERTIRQLKDNLLRSDMDINSKQAEEAEVSHRTETLRRRLQDEVSFTRNHGDELDRKKARINLLKERMALLQEELTREQSELDPLERSMLLSEQKSVTVENQLYDHIEELDGIVAVKQALQEEKEAIARNLEHQETELLSMQAIHELAMAGDCSE